MQTKYCLKVFQRVNKRLTSVGNVYPITYRINQWNKAPKGTGLFVYTEENTYITELSFGREIWLCEYRGLRKECLNFFSIYYQCEGEKVSLERLQSLYQSVDICKKITFLATSVKPIEKLLCSEYYNRDEKDIISRKLLVDLSNKNLTK